MHEKLSTHIKPTFENTVDKKTKIITTIEKNQYALVVCIFIISSIFSFYKVGSSLMNIDGERWYTRSSNFIKEVKKLNFRQTFQNSKPGVPVMWLSGISNEIFYSIYESRYNFKPGFFSYETFPLVFTSYVAPLVLVNLLSGICFYFLVKKLLQHNKAALISYVFFSFHPYYLGMSRFLHVDSVMTNFSILSYLLFLLFMKNQKQFKYLILSGVLLGLALLTKTQALVLIPIMLISSILNLFFKRQKFLAHKERTSNKNCILYFLKTVILPLSCCLLVSFIIYFISFPSMWVAPIKTLNRIFPEAVYVATTGRSLGNIQPYYHYIFLLRSTISYPIMVLFFISCIYIFINRKSLPKDKLLIYSQIIIFPIIYFIEISVAKQKIDRYLLPMLPFLFIGISIFLSRIKYSNIITVFVTLIFIEVLIYNAPNYALFGCRKSNCSTYGYMFKEVGDYINSNSKKDYPNVVTPEKLYSLKPFVRGNTFDLEYATSSEIDVDYLVLRYGYIDNTEITKNFSQCVYLHRVYFHKVPFYDIYGCNND